MSNGIQQTDSLATASTHEPVGLTYWRSLNERADSPAVRESLLNEFPQYDPDELLALGRRKFMALAGASMALAGLTLTGCRRWPKEQVLAYNARPDGTMPGVPEKFASMVERDGYARGLFVTSFDGRPIKADGSPLDPTVGDPETVRVLAKAAESGDVHAIHKLDAFVGVADPRAQSMTLEMYDPDRSRGVLKVSQTGEGGDAKIETELSSWDAFAQADVFAGNKVAVLAEPMSGPAAADLRDRFEREFGSGSWHTWSPLNRDSEVAGSELAFGKAKRAHYDTAAAQVIACFDCDFLNDHPTAIRNAKGWAKNRRAADPSDRNDKPSGSINRLYAAGPEFTPTLAAADDHVQVKPSAVPTLLNALAAKLGVLGSEHDANLNGSGAFVEYLAKDLKAAKGQSIVVAGASQPASVHALVWAINDALGNLGKTITVTEEPAAERPLQSNDLQLLIEKLNAGNVDTLLVLGGNPAFDAPADLGLADAMGKAGTVVRLGLYFDDTSAVSGWHLPMAHPFECWGDGQAWDGTVLLQQPIIEPLFGGKSSIEVAAMATGDQLTAGYDLIRRAWSGVVGSVASGQSNAVARYNPQTRGWGGPITGLDAEKTWRSFVHDGLVPGIKLPAVNDKPNRAKPAGAAASAGENQVEVVFRPGPAYDGRHANNGWLQELPQPMTKVTWDTPAHLAVLDAEALGVQNGDHVAVMVGETTVEFPCFVNPGQARGTVVLPLGGGREVTGNIGTGVGHNAYPLRRLGSLGHAVGTIEKAPGHTPLATTVDHHLIDPGKLDNAGKGFVENWAKNKRMGKLGASGYLIKEATLEQYLANPNYATEGKHTDVRLQLFDPPGVTDDGDSFVQPNPLGPDTFNIPHAWGMTIDMASCIACNACVAACTAENNVPVVGKDQVLKSREMHWLRIDTYFKGDPTAQSSDAIQSVHMPVACQQCENAPCEQVCPVAATVHDTEGLNTMVYNRCIGTRYCSNNCPYKVRRFNYFDYHAKLDSDFFRSKNVGVEVQNKPWLAFPDMQQGDVIDQVRRMVFNPDVTVRMRGVMEKCTYCTQRITRTKINTKADWARRKAAGEPVTDEDRLLQDGEVRTACQTACPTDAITFGDLNDPDSAVSRQQQHNPRAYKLLEELNARPRTLYLAMLTNPAIKPKKKADEKDHAEAAH